MTATSSDFDTPRFRSGVAARMARMPTPTLRIWERRYDVVNPSRSTAGQRLYSRRDVQRLALLKALSEQGHAIGAIAGLDLAELESLAHGMSMAPSPTDSIVAVGPGWAQPASASHDRRSWQHYASAAAAMAGALPRSVDVLLIRLRSLHSDAVDDVLRMTTRCAAREVVVAYAFASRGALGRLRGAGIRLHRDVGPPADAAALLEKGLPAKAPVAAESPTWRRSARRYSDEQLAAIARASAVVACECPRHVAEFIAQLSAFEDYSDSCASRSADDAALHRYLGDIANSARQSFETALERLAEAESLALAPSAPAARSI